MDSTWVFGMHVVCIGYSFDMESHTDIVDETCLESAIGEILVPCRPRYVTRRSELVVEIRIVTLLNTFAIVMS
jgi:hypothetical protein